MIAGGGGGGRGANEPDDKRIFRAGEVTQKARIRSKREPEYTEAARKFGVTGRVRLRAALLASGEVKVSSIVTRLPHGLTAQAIEAARKMKFEPAVKDGRTVSQYVVFEFNFNP